MAARKLPKQVQPTTQPAASAVAPAPDPIAELEQQLVALNHQAQAQIAGLEQARQAVENQLNGVRLEAAHRAGMLQGRIALLKEQAAQAQAAPAAQPGEAPAG
jgi:uncharacterized protein YlxW (UPF0749 family)